ncbi:L-ascorbate metabolism protein UlaG (beta-lactamase superfamily) [Microbacteriaceae bacterium SG_E_30_P1]|uniref:L-ascorbate metabolism protein UlaG (Beta-lactamase superfamily) n=1 Tax=Antiquaquibacter oligotrophicus TaxID=2880260 RepID=A0ABT6KK71_9MICO|nr:MBL fold metallo-hydrolase [Antiquaquibacter oligotrophicus]MDH6180244.1 L-ascorbate metabolism protein UlaG (beta-lactamase superfamily) [Antiquaquibacter oligotrophicus]UDF14009.1 MBL fold metallo-hydrolase [Antiquaquibacter oligotrophicus]
MSTTTLTWIGGPTAVLEYAGLRIVTDPTFDPPGNYVESGEPPLVKTAGPGIPRSDLGPVDLVLLSHHEHEDNLDYEGLELLATGVPTLSTMKAAGDLFGGGVIGLDNWETHEIGDVTVTAVPALHGPPGSEARLGPVIGFVLEAPGEPTVYVSGDNASLPLVEQIAGAFDRIDIAVLFAGAARVPQIDAQLTLTSEDAATAARTLGVSRVVGLHTSDWEHFSEGPEQLAAAFEGTGLLVDCPRGQRVEL